MFRDYEELINRLSINVRLIVSLSYLSNIEIHYNV